MAWTSRCPVSHRRCRRRLGGEGAETSEREEVDNLGFAIFAALIVLIAPSFGPRVPEAYHRTDTLLNEVRAMAGERGAVAVEVEELRDPLQPQASDRSLLLATVHSKGVPPRARMLVVANEHARELVTGEIALKTLRAAAGADGAGPGTWRELLDQGLELSVVPVANVEGRQLAESLRPCQRGTADVPLVATDLNRNFPTDWTPGFEYNYLNSSLDFHGTGPFSAYQARILREVALRHPWDAFVDLHSGSLALNVPFGHRQGGSRDLPEQLRAMEEVRQLCPECKMGPLREVMRYDSPGQLMDWMYEDRGVVYSYLWEVFGRNGLCAPHFNPMDEASLSFEQERWSSALAALAKYVMAQRLGVGSMTLSAGAS